MEARVIERPDTFDRVDRVKEAVGQPVLPTDDRFWILGQALTFQVDGRPFVVPKGFTTDGASVPWWAQVLTGWRPWDEPQRWAAIVHDWAYCSPGVRKLWADRAFRAVLKSEGAGWLRREVMYLAVRIGGGPAYRTDQRQGVPIFVDSRAPRLT
jgi:hypothetical protein